MKLTIAEQEFIHDAQVYIERYQTPIFIDPSKYSVSQLSMACKEHLGVNAWFNFVKHPHQPLRCYLETDFSERYISNVFTEHLEFITPKPFEVIHDSQRLEVREDVQRANFELSVKFFKENILSPQPPPLTFWQKVKQFFA